MAFRNKRLAILTMACASFSLTACDSVVERVEPRQSVTPDQALGSVDGIEALIISGYDRLQQFTYYGQQFMLVPDALADNINVPTQTSNRYPSFVANVIGTHLNAWALPYAGINDMNLVLSRVADVPIQETEAEAARIRARLRGEALFLRSLMYFDLVRTKAYEPGREVNGFREGVIIRTEPTLTVEGANFLARATNVEVYDLIIRDLQESVALLTQRNRALRNFATPASANGLLAKVQLYAGRYAAAEAAAAAAIAATTATLVADNGTNNALVTAWRQPSHPESVFELTMTAARDGDATTVNQSLQSLTDPRVTGGFFDAAATPELVAAHEAGDARLGLYQQIVRAGQTVTFITKYTGTGGAANVDRVPVMRRPELHLILAEARAEQSNVAGALQALNQVRAARNLPALAGLTGDQIIQAVMQERRVELAFEGHRFFDLKRRGMDIPKPQLAVGSIPYTNFRILAPIPNQEATNNPLLNQNPGY